MSKSATKKTKTTKANKPAKTKSAKANGKLSCLDAAAKVLAEANAFADKVRSAVR